MRLISNGEDYLIQDSLCHLLLEYYSFAIPRRGKEGKGCYCTCTFLEVRMRPGIDERRRRAARAHGRRPPRGSPARHPRHLRPPALRSELERLAEDGAWGSTSGGHADRLGGPRRPAAPAQQGAAPGPGTLRARLPAAAAAAVLDIMSLRATCRRAPTTTSTAWPECWSWQPAWSACWWASPR